jgi:hypothetical protein
VKRIWDHFQPITFFHTHKRKERGMEKSDGSMWTVSSARIDAGIAVAVHRVIIVTVSVHVENNALSTSTNVVYVQGVATIYVIVHAPILEFLSLWSL